MRHGRCAGIALGVDRLVMLRTAPAPPRTRSKALPALLRTAVASDDLRRCQRVGAEARPDPGARGSCVERQRWDLERMYGDLVVMRVVADRRARAAVIRKYEVVPPPDCARWQILRALAAGAGRQAMDRSRDVEHAPMPPALAVPGVGVNHRHREALCAGRFARPIERRRNVLSVAAAEHMRQGHRAAALD